MKLTFLGTGTSQGVPVLTCGCHVCTSNDPKDKRLRTSALLQHNSTKIAIDAGPDFRAQMLKTNTQKLDAVLLTHAHHDHVAGLDDVRAYNFRQKMAMPIYGNKHCLQQVQRFYNYAFEEDKYPGVPQFLLKEIPNHRFQVQTVDITPIPVLHGMLPILGFRFGNLSYITDASEIPQNSMHLLEGTQILVINALRHEKHHSHFNIQEAIEIIENIQPQMAYLTHISHLSGTHEQLIKELPPYIKPAFDGLSITI
jgi:phosphoribosyl 1,2-cyclic phosphate phosphodiesterase